MSQIIRFAMSLKFKIEIRIRNTPLGIGKLGFHKPDENNLEQTIFKKYINITKTKRNLYIIYTLNKLFSKNILIVPKPRVIYTLFIP